MIGPYDNGLRIRAVEEMWRGPGLSLFGMVLDHTGRNVSIATGLTVTTADEGMACGSFSNLSMAGARLLMDDLWRAGVRPTDSVSGDATLDAVRGHLSDMRKLVAHHSKCSL